jgi:hypothetical protein
MGDLKTAMARITYFLFVVLLGVVSFRPAFAVDEEFRPDTIFNGAAPSVTALPVYQEQQVRPSASDPSYVAMTFYRLSGQMPDFASWARMGEPYKHASDFDKPMVEEQEAKSLKDQYSLFSIQEPLVIETPVKISAYDPVNQGFFIDNFRKDTFFPIPYDNRSYAIVIPDLLDKQYLKVTDVALAKMIDDAALAAKDRTLVMAMILTPTDADGTGAVTMDGKEYWAISADIKKMLLYGTGDSKAALWQTEDPPMLNDEKSRAVMKLKQ